MKTVQLSKGFVAMVSDIDYARVRKYKWYVSVNTPTRIYAVRNGKNKKIYLHRFIKEASGSLDVDHRNRNTLDCRRRNLRVGTRHQNLGNQVRNPGRLKGITRLPSGNWVAQITVNYKRLYLGSFPTDEEAAKVYDVAARKHFGTFARTNFPKGQG